MSYSDILRVKHLGKFRKLLTNPLYSRIPSIIVANGLVMYLNGKDFTNSPQTTTWLDESGLGSNATPSAFGYTVTSGSDGAGGVVFDGVDDIATITAPLHVQTVVVKFKVPAFTASSQFLIDKYNAAYGFSLFTVATSGLLSVRYTNLVWNGTVNICDNKVHIAIMSVNNDGTASVYLDGVLMQTFTGITIDTVLGNIVIGDRTNGSFLKGTLYSAILYNRGLTNAEIAQNYNASK